MYKALPVDVLWLTHTEREFIELVELTSDARREAAAAGIVPLTASINSTSPLFISRKVRKVYDLDLIRHNSSYAFVRAYFHSTAKEPTTQTQRGEEQGFLASAVLNAAEERRLLRFVSSWLHKHQPEKLKEYVQNTISKRVPK